MYDKVHDLEEERYFAKAVQLRLHGNWTRWCNYIQNELSWKHLLVTSPRLTSFVLGETFDTLPSPMNLRRRHITTEADCSLCSVKVCTTAHVLCGCKVALSQGRYTFRHDLILRVLHNSLSKLLSSMCPVKAYCAYNVRSCFRRLGLNTKETKVVLSELTSTAIQCSFVIWLNRGNKIWNEQATSTFDIHRKAPRKQTPFKSKVSKHSNGKYSQPLSKFYRPGFINKGNTCYMNALLQALSVLTGFWSTLPALASEEQDISPLVAAYCQIMFFLKFDLVSCRI